MAMTSAAPLGMTSNTALEPGFGSTLRSEWTKLRSLRATWIIVSLGIGLSVGFSALIALVSGLTHDSWNDATLAAFDPVLTTNSGSLFGCILLIMLGVTAVTAEYSSGMIRTTFVSTPRRLKVFTAKTMVVAAAWAGDYRDRASQSCSWSANRSSDITVSKRPASPTAIRTVP